MKEMRPRQLLIRFDICFCPHYNDTTTTKDSVMSTNTTPTRSNRWSANSSMESRKLSHKESDWNLPGTALPNTRTRHGGHGRPDLNRKGSVEKSCSDEDEDVGSDEEYAPNSSDMDDSETEADDLAPENTGKPPATRVILEVDSLTKMIYELSKCPDCNVPIDVDIKTTCIASHVKAACLNVECGYVLHSNLPAPMTMHEKSKDNYNRTTDYAVNVLHVLGMMCNGNGCSEAAKRLGLLGLPNDTTMEGRSFHIIEECIGRIIHELTDETLLENLIEEARLSMDN